MTGSEPVDAIVSQYQEEYELETTDSSLDLSAQDENVYRELCTTPDSFWLVLHFRGGDVAPAEKNVPLEAGTTYHFQ